MRGFIGASTVPLTYAYFLLESKSAESYTLALSTIKTAASLFNPPKFMVDFETSEHRAIRSVYPHSTIHDCLFHWKQAIIRHFSPTLPTYGTNHDLRTDFCAFFGLAFVPVDDVEPCWQLLKAYLIRRYPAASTTTIINYLEATWLYSAKYPRTTWNMYQSVKDVDPRTNNVSEGGNNSINTAAGCSHPRICPFIGILQKYNAEQKTRFIQFDSEMGDPRRRKSSHTRDRDERISRIVDSDDGLNPLCYLKKIGNLYQ